MKKSKIFITGIILLVLSGLSFNVNSQSIKTTKNDISFDKTQEISKTINWDGRDTKLAGSFMKPDAVTLLNSDKNQYEAGGFINPDGSTSTYLRIIKPDNKSEIEDNKVKNAEIIKKSESYVKVYPSAFSKSTTFYIQTDEELDINIAIFDIFGRQVKNIEVPRVVGTKTIEFNRGNLPSGTYIYEVSDNNSLIETGKIIIIY